MNIDQLNNNFSLDTANVNLDFHVGADDIPIVKIQNAKANAEISLQGAHVLSWRPSDENEVIWLSKEAVFAKGKSVRGGIPVCWPWFGAHKDTPSFPAHGFARTVMWQVSDTCHISDNETQITFQLITSELDEKNQSMWPCATTLEYRIRVGEKLTLELTTFNQSEEPITIGQALHTYFNIENITNTEIHGLEGKSYLDKVENFNSKIQKGPITIHEEVDRVYLDTVDDVIIDNKKRKIRISKQGSSSTIVWNPWVEVANKMGDLGENGYQEMVCVESANAMNDVLTIKSGESDTLFVVYEIE